MTDFNPDLFAALDDQPRRMELATGAVLMRGFALRQEDDIVAAYQEVVAVAPFRHMVTPGGQTMSVAMTNCGTVGWVTDRRGYRYDRADPLTGIPWPAMSPVLRDLAHRAAAEAGYPGFEPDACLINRYTAGSRLTLHQDKNERDFGEPIVSLSLGLPAKFLFGGIERNLKSKRVMLHHGDVTVWGGPSRLSFHGVDTLKDGEHWATGSCRINLTFRKAL
jgi:alkylated DNA repair protein (DNA oxidative demethylase)